jgi:VanZ family protein
MRWLAVALVAAAIFSLSVIAVPPEDPVVPAKPELVDLDKWRHFLAYGALGAAVGYALADHPKRTATVIAVGVGATVAYGVGIEAVQSLIPFRYFSTGDAVANALGALLSTPLALLLRRAPSRPVLSDVGPSRGR